MSVAPATKSVNSPLIFGDRRSGVDVGLGYAGQIGDEPGNLPIGIDESLKLIHRLPGGELDGSNLDNLISLGGQSGGLKVECDPLA